MKRNTCYAFYFCMGLLVLALHAVGLTSDPESLPMLIVLGFPVSIPLILFCIVLPAIQVARSTFSAEPRDKLLVTWFFINLSFWIVFINNYIFVFRPLVFPTPAVFTLSYLYALLSVFLPAIRKISPSSLVQVLALSLVLIFGLVGTYFYDFHQNEFSSKRPLSMESRHLIEAIDRGDITSVKRMLASDVDLDARDEHGWDPLLHAVYWRHTQIVEYLLEAGADPNTHENKSGMKDFDPEGKTGQVISGRSAIEYAMRQKPPDILWLLLQYGGQATISIDELSDVAIAAGSGNASELSVALESSDDVVNDSLAVKLAAMALNDELLQLLLEAGADPTPGIFQAVRKMRIENLELLLESGGNPNAVNHAWWTPLAYAQTAKAAHLLVSAGADVNYVNPGGYPSENSILTKVAGEGLPEVIAALISAGADINHQNYHGHTALMTADDVETIKILLDAGADSNTVDKGGLTAYDHAKARGNIAALSLLAH